MKLSKILLVDDALPIRRKMLEILHRTGAHASDVFAAPSSAEALELFVREHPAIVLAELVGADPEEGLAMIREMLTLDPHVRIVLVTAEDPAGPLVRRAVRMGVFDVLQKPVRTDAIRRALDEVEAEDGGMQRFR